VLTLSFIFHLLYYIHPFYFNFSVLYNTLFYDGLTLVLYLVFQICFLTYLALSLPQFLHFFSLLLHYFASTNIFGATIEVLSVCATPCYIHSFLPLSLTVSPGTPPHLITVFYGEGPLCRALELLLLELLCSDGVGNLLGYALIPVAILEAGGLLSSQSIMHSDFNLKVMIDLERAH
jgi:hypothetical protein